MPAQKPWLEFDMLSSGFGTGGLAVAVGLFSTACALSMKMMACTFVDGLCFVDKDDGDGLVLCIDRRLLLCYR